MEAQLYAEEIFGSRPPLLFKKTQEIALTAQDLGTIIGGYFMLSGLRFQVYTYIPQRNFLGVIQYLPSNMRQKAKFLQMVHADGWTATNAGKLRRMPKVKDPK